MDEYGVHTTETRVDSRDCDSGADQYTAKAVAHDDSYLDSYGSSLPLCNGISTLHLPSDSSLYTIHRAVYDNDVSTVRSLVRGDDADLSIKDVHGLLLLLPSYV